MSALSFCFESNQVRVLGDVLNPLFIAVDICKALGFQDAINAIKRHVDSDDICKQEIIDSLNRKQEVNCINESGMYALIFGSKLPSAKRFKKWVTSEVLPAIRKTGQYSTADKMKAVETITPRQQFQIRMAVQERAKSIPTNYRSMYRAIYNRYKIAKYDQLPEARFDECLEFIRTMDLATLAANGKGELVLQESGRIVCPFYHKKGMPLLTISDTEMMAIARLYMTMKKPEFKESLWMTAGVLRAARSADAASFAGLVKDLDFSLSFIESLAQRNNVKLIG